MISFLFNNVSITLTARNKLKLYISKLFATHSVSLSSLTYVFCSDEYLLTINRQFLNHEDYTDIITFNYAVPGQPVIGEVYVSVDRIKENASRFDVTVTKELHRVIFHGALHLCGYTDKHPGQKKRMTNAEDACLKEYFGF